ncbi:conserved hypothetical protein [Lebetimonas natsushimae]|uniref:Transformation system protein n=1 Tax=Lebetimonas natsushimae TaxID=1936991 RepID=A0A292Y8E7_9BACT|nr:CDC27 family protein [Lebetimonas natsushimae]GAX87082.1 conserved hypothetical protein [Lebetimonas natsushimae]
MTFFELERECKKRKRKKIFLLIFLIIILLISAVIFNKYKIIDKIKVVTNNKKENNLTVVNKKEKDKNETKIKKNISKIYKIIKTDVIKPIIYLNMKDINVSKIEKKHHKNKLNKKNDFNKTHKFLLNTSTLPSFETCIMLAEKYYKNRDYENALKWAKNANIQNKEDPKSWVIVAKSLYKLNKKDKAVEILQLYYKYTKNKDILNLIERMKNGENF